MKDHGGFLTVSPPHGQDSFDDFTHQNRVDMMFIIFNKYSVCTVHLIHVLPRHRTIYFGFSVSTEKCNKIVITQFEQHYGAHNHDEIIIRGTTVATTSHYDDHDILKKYKNFNQPKSAVNFILMGWAIQPMSSLWV